MIDYAQLRRTMVDGQIRVNDVTDPHILAAMLEIPRERFVPDARASLAYFDEDFLVREAKAGKPARFLTEPRVMAKLLQALELSPDDRVLDIGCATGYSSALLSRLVRQVMAVEEDEELALIARRNLAGLGLANVTVVTEALTAGYSGQGPYQAIFLNGSVERVPDALMAQLDEGGRLGAVVQSGPMGQATRFVRTAGTVSQRFLFDASVPPLPGFQRPRGFVF